MYDTLIFDLDGTLLYTLEDIHDAVNHVLGENGYSLNTLEDTRNYVGNGLKQLMKRSLPEDAGKEVLDRLAEELCDYYADHCQIKTRPYDGILECLEKLKSQGYQMAIVSNKIDEAVKELNALYFGKYRRTGRYSEKTCAGHSISGFERVGSIPGESVIYRRFGSRFCDLPKCRIRLHVCVMGISRAQLVGRFETGFFD